MIVLELDISHYQIIDYYFKFPFEITTIFQKYFFQFPLSLFLSLLLINYYKFKLMISYKFIYLIRV
jgi:hypothetical protein